LEVKENTLKIDKKQMENTKKALPFILPGLILAAIFIFYPTIRNIVISFSEYNLIQRTMTFNGLDNYIALINEPQNRFFLAYRNNILYALIVTPFTLFLGLLLASSINSLKKLSVTYRTIYYLPVITSWIIAGLVFKYLFNAGIQGPINYLLVEKLHIIKEPVNWLKTEWGGNFAIWVLGIWKNVGYAMVLYIAALQGISRSYYEAAEIEGANRWQVLRRITMPSIKPITYFLTIQLLIGSFNVFLQVLVLTGGEPRGQTSSLQYLLYSRTFELYKFGEGAVIGVITAVSILVFTILLNKSLHQDNVFGAK